MLGSSGVLTSTTCLDLETSWCHRPRLPRFLGLRRNLRLLRTSPCTAFIKGTRAAAAAPSSSGELLRFQQSGGWSSSWTRSLTCPLPLVRFGGIYGGFAVAVLQLGKLLLVLSARMLDITSGAVSAAFGEVPLLQFIDEWWLLQLLLRSGSQCKLWRRQEIPWCSSGWLSTCTFLCK